MTLAHAGEPITADQGRAAFQAGDYVGAARAFEAIYASGNEPKYLYNAGIARKHAGHLPEAIFHFSAYVALAGRISAADSTDAQQRIGESIPGTTSVAVTVAPAEALAQATISIQARGGPQLQAPLKAYLDHQGVQPGAYLLYLDTRPWTVVITSPGYEPATATLTLGPQDQARMLSLSLKPEATAVEVAVGPEAALAAGIALTFVDNAGHPIEVARAQSLHTQNLKPGTYNIRASAPGYRTVERPLIVGREPHRLSISLVPDPTAVAAPTPTPQPPPVQGPIPAAPSPVTSDSYDPRTRKILGIAYGVTAVGLAGASVGLAVVGHNQFATTTDQNAAALAQAGISDPANLEILSDPEAMARFDTVEAIYPKATLASDLGRAMSLQYAAAGTAGASLGMLVTSLTAAKARSPRAWKIELGIGATLATAGAVWFGVQHAVYQNQLVKADVDEVRYDAFRLDGSVTRQFRASGLASAMILGAGASLAVGSGIGLAVDKRSTPIQAHIAPAIGRGTAGVNIAGRF